MIEEHAAAHTGGADASHGTEAPKQANTNGVNKEKDEFSANGPTTVVASNGLPDIQGERMDGNPDLAPLAQLDADLSGDNVFAQAAKCAKGASSCADLLNSRKKDIESRQAMYAATKEAYKNQKLENAALREKLKNPDLSDNERRRLENALSVGQDKEKSLGSSVVSQREKLIQFFESIREASKIEAKHESKIEKQLQDTQKSQQASPQDVNNLKQLQENLTKLGLACTLGDKLKNFERELEQDASAGIGGVGGGGVNT